MRTWLVNNTSVYFFSSPGLWSMILWRKRPERKDKVHEFPVWNVHEAHSRSTSVGRNAPSRTQTIILQVIYSWSPADVLYIELWKATATAPEQRSTKLTDQRQLCAALPCVALQHPVRILPWKTLLILKRYQLFSTKAQRMAKNAEIGSLGTRTVCSHDNLIRSGTIYPDMVFTRRQRHIVSVSSSKVSTFSIVFVSSLKFAEMDRLRVNRRPIRKDFFPERYGFVPIIFTSSSCKRGLREEIYAYESEVTDFVVSQTLCMHAIAMEAWAAVA